MKRLIAMSAVALGATLFALHGAEACCGACGAGAKLPQAQKTGARTCGADAKNLCAKCGQVKGSPACCKPGTEKCAKCGLDKGSPGCCKLSAAK